MKRLQFRAVVIVFLLLAGLLNPALVSAQGGPAASTITVSGVGTAAGRPDIASVELGFEVVNTNLEAAYSRANEIANALTQALLKLNIAPADIQTIKMTLAPKDQSTEGAAPTGNFVYNVRGVFRVTIRNVSQINQVLSAALAAGANIIDNLGFGIDDLGLLEQQARTQAIKNARDRANQLAQDLGVFVGDPISITETAPTESPVTWTGTGSRGAALAAGQAADGNVGQLVVTVQIQVIFTLKKTR